MTTSGQDSLNTRRSLSVAGADYDYFSANRIGSWFADTHRSDHDWYWREGIPAIMLNDTTDFRNPHYHLPSDLPETLNYRFLGNVTRAVVATCITLARPDGY